jgi:RNA-binding protein
MPGSFLAVSKTLFQGNHSMPISSDRKKQFRSIGHKLNPIVTIAGNGLSDGVLLELNRALDDHELIKVKLSIEDRDDRKAMTAQLQALPNIELVQEIGKVVLLYRGNKKADPKLSNLHRK